MAKYTKRIQVILKGKLKEKFEQHKQETEFPESTLMKHIANEYYSKINTKYNKD